MDLARFRTKKDRLAYVKKIIYDLGTCVIRSDHSQFNMFVELVKDKYQNVEFFSIVPNRRNYSSLETQAHMLDGTINVFSWNKCALDRKDTDHKKLRDVLRSAIVPDILEFKRDAICCMICGRTEYLHADHIDPFRDLVNKYIEDHGNNISNRWICGFVDYHKEHARLQILCASCNYKKH